MFSSRASGATDRSTLWSDTFPLQTVTQVPQVTLFLLLSQIHYASKDTLMRSVYEKYSPDKKGEEEIPPGSYSVEQILGEKNYPESEKNARHGGRAVLHSSPLENGA